MQFSHELKRLEKQDELSDRLARSPLMSRLPLFGVESDKVRRRWWKIIRSKQLVAGRLTLEFD